MPRVTFTIGNETVVSEWRDTETARKLLAALPLTAQGSYWGGEFYFPVPVKAAVEADASEVVEPGTVAFWTQGSCLCLFGGPTPASHGDECRAANAVNVVGRVENPEVLRRLKGRTVTVAAAVQAG